MIVMKFGGTSVGDAACIRNLAAIVRGRLPRRPVVVVSAMAGVTDGLLAAFGRAVSGRGAGRELVSRHEKEARRLGIAVTELAPELGRLRETLDGVRERRLRSPRDRDVVASFGERLSARLVAACLRGEGIAATAVRADEAGLVTDDTFGEAEPLPAAIPNLRRALGRIRGVPVVTGFIGRTRDGSITTLGRGGSDFTAALVGAAMRAEEVEIWTDVNGVMSADPRVVPQAHTIDRLSFAEAAELAYFGAKVLHPKTLLPAMRRGIPVRVLNTREPTHAGTRVSRTADRSRDVVKAIAAKKGIVLVNVVSTRMLLAHGFLARLFQVFADHRISVDLLSTSEVSVSMTLDRAGKLGEAVRELRRFSQVEVRRRRGVVSVVGEGMIHSLGLAGRVFAALGEEGINVEMVSQGASKLNLSFVVRTDDADRAVRVLHGRFFGRDL
jgi:aspartate kinase